MTALPQDDWRDVLARQDGVISRSQALRHGMSADAWQWAHERQRLQRLLPGVALGHLGAPSARQCAWAAVLHAGTGAALTGDIALVELGMRLVSAPGEVHVAVPEKRVVRRGATLAVDPPVRIRPHRVKDLSSLVHPVRQPPTVRLPVALAHAAAFAPTGRAAEWRVAAAVQQRLTVPGQVRDAVGRLPRLRRRALVLAVLDDVEHGVHAQSELDFLRLLRRHSLPCPDRLQRPVRADGKRYLDAWWDRQRVGAEIDGAHHVAAEQWDADVLRFNEIAVVEQHDRALLLRFTTGNLRHDEAQVVRQLRAVLV